MDDDERRGIEAWLETTGYPLEHRAGEALRAAGYVVRHGPHYPTGQGDARETDLIAGEPNVALGNQILIVVECKHAVRPWIVRCMTNELQPAEMTSQLIAHRDAVAQLRKDLQTGRIGDDEIPFIVRPSALLGFSVIEGPQTAPTDAAKRDRDSPYQALQSVVGAARALSQRRSVYEPWWACLPILVVEGSLFTLRDTSTPDLARADWQRVSWDGLPDGRPALVDVVEAEYLPTYLDMLREDTQWLAGWMKRQPPPTNSMIA